MSTSVFSAKVPANYTPGQTPDALWAELQRYVPMPDTAFHKIEQKTPVTLAGRPALEVRVFENKNWMAGNLPQWAGTPEPPVTPEPPDDPNMPEGFRQAREKQREMQREMAKKIADQRKQQEELRKQQDEQRKAQAAEEQKTASYWVYYVTCDDKKVYVIKVENTGSYADPGMLKTITDSFQFVQ
jgi:hypothetical protein